MDKMIMIKYSILFFILAFISLPLFANETHWVDDFLPYILFDLVFIVSLWLIITCVKVTTKLFSVRDRA